MEEGGKVIFLKDKKSQPGLSLDPQLDWITRLLNKKKIKYIMDGGSLLGILREGKLFKRDEDIDISVSEVDKEKLKLILPEIEKAGYKVEEGYYKKLLFSYTLFPPTNSKGREIDIKIFRKYMDYAWCPERYAKNSDKKGLIYYWSKSLRLPFLLLIKIIPNKSLKSLIDRVFFKFDTWRIPLKYMEKTKFLENTKIPIPLNWEQYLRFRFGNWKIPNTNWNYIHDDGGLENKEPVSLGIPVKKFN